MHQIRLFHKRDMRFVQLEADDSERAVRFDDLVAKAIAPIAQLRNTAAHTESLPRCEYTELQSLVFQGGRLGYGALNALLLGWRDR